MESSPKNNKRRRPTGTDDDLTPNKNENKKIDLSESTRELKAKESAEKSAQGTRGEVERKGKHDRETKGEIEGRRDKEEPATPGSKECQDEADSPEGAANL